MHDFMSDSVFLCLPAYIASLKFWLKLVTEGSIIFYPTAFFHFRISYCGINVPLNNKKECGEQEILELSSLSNLFRSVLPPTMYDSTLSNGPYVLIFLSVICCVLLISQHQGLSIEYMYIITWHTLLFGSYRSLWEIGLFLSCSLISIRSRM